MKKFKKSLELNKMFVKNTSPEELESLMADFDKYDTNVKLMQTAVVGQSEQLPKCKHTHITREDGCDECQDCGVRNY